MLCKELTKEKLNNPKDVAELCRAALLMEDKCDQDKEHFWAIGVNTKNQVLYMDLVCLGILDGCIVHAREIFRLAILKGVKSIILAHNHPSGYCEPSRQDDAMTEEIKNSGDILGINVLDHVVISNDSDDFYSYSRNRQDLF